MTSDLEFEKMFPVPEGVVLMRNNFYASPDGNLIAHIEAQNYNATYQGWLADRKLTATTKEN